MNLRHAAFVLSLALMLADPVLANNEFDGNISIGFNDNISNAVSKQDIFDDVFLAADFNATRLWVPAVGRSVTLSGHLGLEDYRDSQGLNRFSYGASLGLSQRLGLGAYAPRIVASLRADYRNYDTDMRDGMLYRASLGLEKRFTPFLMTGATLTREWRKADANRATPYVATTSGDVFNQDNSEIAAFADYTLPNNAVVSARLLYRHGETDASTNPGSAFFSFTRAIAQDHQLCKTCGNYVAYLVDADIHALQLAWNHELGRDTSLSASIERRIADVDGGITYTGSIYRLQLFRRF